MRRTVQTIVISALAAGIVATVAVGVTILIMHDTRQDISLADIASSDWSPDPTPEMFQGMRDETATLCAGIEGCMEGYEADQARYYRFDLRHHAAAFARVTADSFQSDWIVIAFTDETLTDDQRRSTREVFDELAVSD